MSEKLRIGQTHTITRTVTPELTAERFGNPGVSVFATPALVALLEATAIELISPVLADDQGSVGTHVEVSHVAPTPAGMKITARVELIEIDGRRMAFKVEAHDEIEQIASGSHKRIIVNSMTKFIERSKQKSV